MSERVHLGVYVTPEEASDFRSAAEAVGLNLSDALRVAIADYAHAVDLSLNGDAEPEGGDARD